VADLTHLTLDAVSADDDTALHAWFELERDAGTHDVPGDPPPCRTAHRRSLAAPWPGTEPWVWLARIDGEAVGVGTLELPYLDNTDNATGGILVAPGHRRRGIGRRMLALLSDEARHAGRVRLIGETWAPLVGPAPGPAFAAAVGAREVLQDVRRRLRLPGDGERARAFLGAQPVAAGYDLVQWTDGTPAERLDDMARLSGRMYTDAPFGDLHLAPEGFDARRARDEMCRARGIRVTVTAARSTDGMLVAFTEIAVAATVPWHGANWDTLVQPEHRGRGLGLRVNPANLALTRHARLGPACSSPGAPGLRRGEPRRSPRRSRGRRRRAAAPGRATGPTSTPARRRSPAPAPR